jgi:formamidopyrimidine-DNA glycosylase
MPELPEVETIRRQLEKFLVGHRIEKVDVKTSKIFIGNKKALIGGIVKKVRRFGKVLAIDLDNGFSAICHLKLTGQFIYRGPRLRHIPKISKKVLGGVPGKHTHVIFYLDREAKLYYNDVRKFGWIKAVKTSDVEKTGFIGKLGPEPLDGLTLPKFRQIIGSSKRAIKVLLMDQTKIGGVGNIYANDGLWLAKVNPKRSANSLSESEQSKLYKAVIKVLKNGLKYGGSSDLAYVTPEGSEGKYQKHFLAYGKGGKVCSRCKKSKIKKISLGGRGTYFCALCQK